MAGFGVPVAVVAPLLVLMGFSPVRAAAIVLVGHAWAVTFGSMGSSYYTIQLVTGISGDVIGPQMAALFALPIIVTGFAVAHLQGGLAAVRRGAPGILVIGGAMALSVWIAALVGVPQLASIIPGLVGAGVGWLVSKTPLLGRSPRAVEEGAPVSEGDANESEGTEAASGVSGNFHMAFLPYYLVILFSILSQVPAIKSAANSLFFALDYPALETALGFEVGAEQDYARIRFFRHPAPLILASLFVSYLVYQIAGRWRSGTLVSATRLTYSQSISTSVGIGAMVMMAVIMTDTGMTALLGRRHSGGYGGRFSHIRPVHRCAGHVHDGEQHQLQRYVRRSATGERQRPGHKHGDYCQHPVDRRLAGQRHRPAKVLVGTTIVGLSGRENEVMRRTIPYCLGIVLLVGIQAWIILRFFG